MLLSGGGPQRRTEGCQLLGKIGVDHRWLGDALDASRIWFGAPQLKCGFCRLAELIFGLVGVGGSLDARRRLLRVVEEW